MIIANNEMLSFAQWQITIVSFRKVNPTTKANDETIKSIVIDCNRFELSFLRRCLTLSLYILDRSKDIMILTEMEKDMPMTVKRDCNIVPLPFMPMEDIRIAIIAATQSLSINFIIFAYLSHAEKFPSFA